MIKKFYPSLTLYSLCFILIAAWWYAAFVSSNEKVKYQEQTSGAGGRILIEPPQYLSYLSPMDREQIKRALGGDVALMSKLMADWDVDARILENQGLSGMRRLPREKFLKAQIIGRKLEKGDPDEIAILSRMYLTQNVRDDLGVPVPPDRKLSRFLPQTYVSASVLLALTEPENIVAIPQGFRSQTMLYPESITGKIPLDIDRHHSEAIYQGKPDVAFVAHYSHPSTLQALKNQGIPLFTIKSIDTIPQISEAIHRIGHVVQKPLEAELLTLFMESAMFSIDNRLSAVSQAAIAEHGAPRVMFLEHYTHFSMPTEKTITGHLLKRLTEQHFTFLTGMKQSGDGWSTPIEQELIMHLNPECLIICSSSSKDSDCYLEQYPAFAALPAASSNRIFCIDSTPQAPTQYIVLAYYDIAEALAKATSPYARTE